MGIYTIFGYVTLIRRYFSLMSGYLYLINIYVYILIYIFLIIGYINPMSVYPTLISGSVPLTPHTPLTPPHHPAPSIPPHAPSTQFGDMFKSDVAMKIQARNNWIHVDRRLQHMVLFYVKQSLGQDAGEQVNKYNMSREYCVHGNRSLAANGQPRKL